MYFYSDKKRLPSEVKIDKKEGKEVELNQESTTTTNTNTTKSISKSEIEEQQELSEMKVDINGAESEKGRKERKTSRIRSEYGENKKWTSRITADWIAPIIVVRGNIDHLPYI